ncbi:DUF2894 domain-containing protein [Trinickia sp. EG282A]|uniref:DUF2894 domain-containing protein n=1 Tax=Trinickia sp. EG282A TaxID=3237013 RepID=UPI0034D20376
MNSAATEARARLGRWKACGADRHDPIRFRFIEALERRTAELCGEARRLLEERLSLLIQAYADEVESAASQTTPTEAAMTPREPARGLLAELVDSIANRSSASGMSLRTGDPAHWRHPGAEFEALGYFREVWSKVNVESQLRQSLEQVPDNAGPLNSESLVHRALALMQKASPGYLRQFLSYVEALTSMERMNLGGVSAGKEPSRSGSTRSATKSTRSKPR